MDAKQDELEFLRWRLRATKRLAVMGIVAGCGGAALAIVALIVGTLNGSPEIGGTVRCEALILHGPDGSVKATLEIVGDHPVLVLYDKRGRNRVELGVADWPPEGLRRTMGEGVADEWARSQGALGGLPYMIFCDPNGVTRVSLSPREGFCGLRVSGGNGEDRLRLCANGDLAYLAFMDEEGGICSGVDQLSVIESLGRRSEEEIRRQVAVYRGRLEVMRKVFEKAGLGDGGG